MNDKQISLSLPIQIVEYILQLLNEQPRKISDPVFQLIQGQAQAALAPPAPVLVPAPDEAAVTNQKDVN